MAAGARAVGAHVGRVGDVEHDRDVRPEPVEGRPRSVEADLLLRRRDDRDVRTLEPAERFERDVDAGAVVEAARRDPAARELDRRPDHHHRIARLDKRARLLAVARADVDVQLLPLDLLVVLDLARDHARDRAVPGPDLDALAVADVGTRASEPVHGDQCVVGDVRDGEADHVQVRDQREQRAFARAARDEVSDRVGLDLGDVADGVADDVEGQVLVAGRAVRANECFEECWDRHGRRSLGSADALTSGAAALSLSADALYVPHGLALHRLVLAPRAMREPAPGLAGRHSPLRSLTTLRGRFSFT